MPGTPAFTCPDFSGNACAAFSQADKQTLWEAARIMADAGSPAIRIASLLGEGAGWAAGKAAEIGARMFGQDWQDRVQDVVEAALWRAHDVAVIGMDPAGQKAPWMWFNKAVTSASGAVSGIFGLPGAMVDIPISTLVMMRSIAEIARAHGEDLATDDAKRACLEVFAFGSPRNGEDVESGYWTARLSLNHLTIALAVRRVAGAFSAVMSEKIVAGAVPVLGSAAGGMLNYAFIDFYQDMARVHFTIREMERQYGNEAGVRACFDALVHQARARRSLRRPHAVAAPDRLSAPPARIAVER